MPQPLGTTAAPASTTPTAAPGVLNINSLPQGFSIAGSPAPSSNGPASTPGSPQPTSTPAAMNINSLPQGFSVASGIPSAPAASATPSAADTINANYRSGKISAPSAVIQDFGEAAKETNDALTGKSGTVLDDVNPIGWANDALGFATHLIGSGLDKIVDAVAPKVGTTLRAAVGAKNADAVKAKILAAVNSPTAQKLIQTYSSPDVSGDLGAVGNVAGLGMTMAGVAAGGEGLGDVSDAAVNAPDSVVGKAYNSVTDALGQKYIDGAKAEWERPSTISRATYRNAGDIIKNAAKKGTDIPEILVKNGVKLSDNIEDGYYSTADTAQKIRDNAGKASAELLRPSLQLADTNPNAPKIDVESIVNKTIKDIQNSNATPDEIEARVGQVQAKGEALARKYPNGMGLADMHDEKINYAKSGKYSPVNDPATNNSAEVNRAFGRTLAKGVEDNAPNGVPVKEFNAELQKQYQAADYLDSLDKKKVPTTKGAAVRKYVGKLAGTAVGHAVGGGGILADVAGYQIGGMVEQLLEGMKNPLKEQFLTNLRTSNPEAYTALQNYISKGGTPTLALPAGPLGATSKANQAVYPAIADPSMIPAEIDKGVPQTVKPPAQLQLPAGRSASPDQVIPMGPARRPIIDPQAPGGLGNYQSTPPTP